MMLWIWLSIITVLAAVLYSHYSNEYAVHSKGVILITGASTGIGRHAAENLSKKYPNFVFFAGVRKRADATSIESLNIKNLKPIIVDVSLHESVVQAVSEIREFLSKENLPFIALINNAGIARQLALEYHPISDVKYLFDTNVFGSLDLIQQTLPLLRESKGRIIAMSSMAGFVAFPSGGVYCSSKFALEGMHDALRREVSSQGISVSIVQPGFVKSAIGDTSHDASSSLISDADRVAMNLIYKQRKDSQPRDEPSVTTNAIDHAVFSKRPYTRYVVASSHGMPGIVVSWLIWLLNDRLADLLFTVTK